MLTKRMAEVLRKMAKHRDCPEECPDHEDGELVYERGRGFLGLEPVAARVVFALLRLAAVRSLTPMHDIGTPGHIERYEINSTGVDLLKVYETASSAHSESGQ